MIIIIYTDKFINLISFVITCILFILFFIFSNILLNLRNVDMPNITEIIDEISDNKKQDDKKIQEEITDLGSWYIEIPSINLKAPIAEGTDTSTLNTKVGHFEDTPIQRGNIGLAAHNRGYEKNFFKNLKSVKLDDEINYYYDNIKTTYVIDTIEIIESTDWSYLDETEDDKITLITCVENEPDFRRCVQATKKEI